MPINDDIVTTPKLIEYYKTTNFDEWDECKHLINPSVFGEMDWYLIDGLLVDYLGVVNGSFKGQTPNEFLTMIDDCFDNPQTKQMFIKMADSFELGK